jgi:hypothetical protein
MGLYFEILNCDCDRFFLFPLSFNSTSVGVRAVDAWLARNPTDVHKTQKDLYYTWYPAYCSPHNWMIYSSLFSIKILVFF